MKKILRYNRFIKEATLSGDKKMPYSLSRKGKSVAMKKLVNEIETSNINNFDIKLFNDFMLTEVEYGHENNK